MPPRPVTSDVSTSKMSGAYQMQLSIISRLTERTMALHRQDLYLCSRIHPGVEVNQIARPRPALLDRRNNKFTKTITKVYVCSPSIPKGIRLGIPGFRVPLGDIMSIRTKLLSVTARAAILPTRGSSTLSACP
jgi:hypothetical protein